MAGYRVLVADDDPAFRRLLSRAIAGRFEVREVSSGEAALAMALNWRPDLVSLDHHMGGWDGLETMRRFQAESRLAEIPMIMCTSDTSTSLLAEAISLGAKGFIGKTTFDAASYRNLVTEVITCRGQIRRMDGPEAGSRGEDDTREFDGLVDVAASSGLATRAGDGCRRH